LGKKIEAEKFTCTGSGNTASTTVEAQIVESLKLIRDGGEPKNSGDSWNTYRNTHCHPARCKDDIAWGQVTYTNLPSNKAGAAGCLQGENEIWVTSKKVTQPDRQVKVFIYCGKNRMPAPSTHEKYQDKWYIQTASW